MLVALHNSHYRPGSLAGLGYPTPTPTPTSNSQIIGGAAVGGAAAGITVGLSTGSIKRGGIAAAGATLLSLAPMFGPVAGSFMAIAGSLVSAAAVMFKGCGASCTETSRVADEAQAAAKQVTDAYWAQSTRYKSSQIAAMAALESIAEQLQAFCSNPAFGDAGKRCISERLVRGGTAPWCPTGTGCDFWSTIYDPIANDKGVVDDTPSATQQLADVLGVSTGADTGLLLLAAGLLVAGVLL